MSQYSKFFVAVVGVIAAGLNALYGNNVDVQLLISVLTALGVYQVKNV